jgi:hypothetical protein
MNITKLFIWWHKRCARNAIYTMQTIQSNSICGRFMLENTNTEYIWAKQAYEYHIAELKRIDPDFGKKA